MVEYADHSAHGAAQSPSRGSRLRLLVALVILLLVATSITLAVLLASRSHETSGSVQDSGQGSGSGGGSANPSRSATPTATPSATASPTPSADATEPPSSGANPGTGTGTGTGKGVGNGTGTGKGTGSGGGGATTGVVSSISIAGNVAPSLQPGDSSPINLTFVSQNDIAVTLSEVSVRIASVTAPRATSLTPCTSADFSVSQPASGLRVIIPANSTTSLSALGVASSSWPRLTMINSDDNQNGCKSATVTLAYSAEG